MVHFVKNYKKQSIKLFLISLIVISLASSVNGKDDIRKISLLEKKPTITNSEIYGELITNLTDNLQIVLIDIDSSIDFIIFQVHSYQHNITLSYQDALKKSMYINGTNVGLYSYAKATVPFFIKKANKDVILQIYLSIHAYDYTAPIPGGCNMEFPNSIAPYFKLRRTSSLIILEASPARDTNSHSCEYQEANMTYQFYQMYMPERNFDSSKYFESIQNMLTVERIMAHGVKVPEHSGYAQLRRLFSLYSGTGSVYVAIVSNSMASSVYVPIQTYGCSFDGETDNCEIINDTFSQIVCASAIFVGLFMCFFGHYFFKTLLFLSGLLAGALLTVIVMGLTSSLEGDYLVGAALASGICFGAIWWIFWWFCGMPMCSVLLPTLLLGSTVGAIFYYVMPDGLYLLENDINFWSIFISLGILTCILLICSTMSASIISSSLIGAYIFIYPIDHYIGSNLKYVTINVLRRATVDGFNQAIINPPVQWKDIVLLVVWLMLAIIGYKIQKKMNKGRPPFPPPPRQFYPVSDTITHDGYPVHPSAPDFPYPAVQYDERTPLVRTPATHYVW